MNPNYNTIKEAIVNAGKGEDAMPIEELAVAITHALYEWGDQKKLIAELAIALAEEGDVQTKVYKSLMDEIAD